MLRLTVAVSVVAATVLLPWQTASGQRADRTADPGGQVARFMRTNPNRFIANAPQPPSRPEDLSLQLVDYIDCTSSTDGHPMLDDGRSRVRKTDLGPYRETGQPANSWFAYRFRVAAEGWPHVVVLQFPDDSDRMAALGLAQPPSGNADKPSARVEFGYRTGDLLPVSGRMLTRWTFFFPTSDEPASLLVANWHARRPAALARVWVYAAEEGRLPPLGLQRPSRHGGRYDFDPRAIHTRFGGRAENLVKTTDYLGLDEVCFNALQGRRFNYPSAKFGSGGNALPQILTALAETDKRLFAVFDPDCSSGLFSMPGLEANAADMADPAVRKAWQSFVKNDFLRSYGAEPNFQGLMFGGPQGAAAFDRKSNLSYTDFLTQLARGINRDFRHLVLFQNLAAPSPGVHYFSEPNSDWSTVSRWEQSAKSIDQCLTARAIDTWRVYGIDEEALVESRQIVPMRQSDRDDSARYRFGSATVPRYWLFDCVARSRGVTETTGQANLRGLILGSTADRRMILLQPGEFWWQWSEMAPTIPPAGREFLAPLALAVADGLSPWTVWFAGNGAATALHEEDVRRAMVTLRNLPLRDFLPLDNSEPYPAAVRTYRYAKHTLVLLANRTPVGVNLAIEFSGQAAVQMPDYPDHDQTVGTLRLILRPWGIRSFRFAGAERIEKISQEFPGLEPMLAARLHQYATDLEAARKAGVPLGGRFDKALQEGRRLLKGRSFAALDQLLHPAVVREPAHRLRVMTARPRADVPARKITVDGSLDDWNGIKPIRLDTLRSLVCTADAANHWRGARDLSAELRLAWNEAGLHFALKVIDDRPTQDENETSQLALSADDYRSFSSRSGFDFVVALPRAADRTSPNLTTRRDGQVTIHEGLLTAEELGEALRPRAGRTIGLNLVVSDSDDRRGMPHPWCKSNLMAWSTRQDGYDVWSDAQTVGELTFK